MIDDSDTPPVPPVPAMASRPNSDFNAEFAAAFRMIAGYQGSVMRRPPFRDDDVRAALEMLDANLDMKPSRARHIDAQLDDPAVHKLEQLVRASECGMPSRPG